MQSTRAGFSVAERVRGRLRRSGSSFGPILSVIPAVLVALFMPFPTVVWVVRFVLAIQQVENNGVGARISGHAVGLHRGCSSAPPVTTSSSRHGRTARSFLSRDSAGPARRPASDAQVHSVASNRFARRAEPPILRRKRGLRFQ
jgi:hypothetical protein